MAAAPDVQDLSLEIKDLPRGMTHAEFNNNPGNIKGMVNGRKTDYAKFLDKMKIPYEMGSSAQDGGAFLHFPDAETGYRAAQMWWPRVKNWAVNRKGKLTLDEALYNYSSGHIDGQTDKYRAFNKKNNLKPGDEGYKVAGYNLEKLKEGANGALDGIDGNTNILEISDADWARIMNQQLRWEDHKYYKKIVDEGVSTEINGNSYSLTGGYNNSQLADDDGGGEDNIEEDNIEEDNVIADEGGGGDDQQGGPISVDVEKVLGGYTIDGSVGEGQAAVKDANGNTVAYIEGNKLIGVRDMGILGEQKMELGSYVDNGDGTYTFEESANFNTAMGMATEEERNVINTFRFTAENNPNFAKTIIDASQGTDTLTGEDLINAAKNRGEDIPVDEGDGEGDIIVDEGGGEGDIIADDEGDIRVFETEQDAKDVRNTFEKGEKVIVGGKEYTYEEDAEGNGELIGEEDGVTTSIDLTLMDHQSVDKFETLEDAKKAKDGFTSGHTVIIDGKEYRYDKQEDKLVILDNEANVVESVSLGDDIVEEDVAVDDEKIIDTQGYIDKNYPDHKKITQEDIDNGYTGDGVFIDENGNAQAGKWRNGRLRTDSEYINNDGTVFKGTFVNGKPTRGTITYADGSVVEGRFKQDEEGNLVLKKGTFTTPDGEEIKDVDQEKLDNLIVPASETSEIFGESDDPNIQLLGKPDSEFEGKAVYYKTLGDEDGGKGPWRKIDKSEIPDDAVVSGSTVTWTTGDGVVRIAAISPNGDYMVNDRYELDRQREINLGIIEDTDVGPSTGPPQGQEKFVHNGVTYYGNDDQKAFVTRTENFGEQWIEGADQEILAELGITDFSQLSDEELIKKYQDAYNVKNGLQEGDDGYLNVDGKLGENTLRTSTNINTLYDQEFLPEVVIEENEQSTLDPDGDGFPQNVNPEKSTLVDTDPDATTEGDPQQQGPGLAQAIDNLGKAGGALLKGGQALLDTVGGPGAIISYIMGKKGLKAAMKEVEPLESPELSPMFMQHLRQTRELAKKGFHPEQAARFRSEIDTAYGRSLENAVRGSGGQRARFLAQTGVLDAQRSAALLDFAAKDAELQQANADKYEKMMLFKENFDLQRTEQQRAEDMARQVADKKAAAGFTSSAFTSLMTSYASGKSGALANQFAKGATDFFNNLTTIGLNLNTNPDDKNENE